MVGVDVDMNMSQTFILKADNYSNKMFPLEHNSCVNTSKDFASSKSLNLSTKKEQKKRVDLIMLYSVWRKPQRY